MATLIYFIGVGRSGSSLIENHFSKMTNVPTVGEISYFADRGFVYNERCSCGQYFYDCPFWSQIATKFTKLEISRYLDLRWEFEATPRFFDSNIKSLLNTVRFQRYMSFCQKLLDVLFEETGSEILIDSSKFPMRGYWVRKNRKYKVLFVHITRNPVAIAYSWGKKKLRVEHNKDQVESQRYMDVYPFYSALARWVAHTVLIGWLRLIEKKKAFYRVRYEDFVENPDDVLTDLINKLSREGCFTIHGISKNCDIDIVHSVSGNPSRITGFGMIKKDTQWQVSLSFWKKLWGQIITFPFWWGR